MPYKKMTNSLTHAQTFWYNSSLWLCSDPYRLAHLGVIAREDLESDRGDEFSDKVQPFLIKIDLFHMNVICRDTLVASTDTLVLQRENTMTGQSVNAKKKKKRKCYQQLCYCVKSTKRSFPLEKNKYHI